MAEFFVHESTRLEVVDRLFPRVLNNPQFFPIAIVVHQQNAFELVVDSEIALGVTIRLQSRLLGVREVLGLT